MNELKKEYFINSLDLDEVNVIITGLGELQAKKSHLILNKILNQINEQDKLKENIENKSE